jgi:1,2-diacylglycerol 3-alpha-glucosyltransferase
MRIAIICENYKPHIDGISIFVQRYIEQLTMRKHHVGIFAPHTTSGESVVPVGKYLTEYRHPSLEYPLHKAYRFGVFTRKYIYTYLHEFRPDVIHVQSFYSPTAFHTLKFAKQHSIPIVTTQHAVPANFLYLIPYLKPLHPIMKKIIWGYYRWYSNSCDAVVSPSKFGARSLIENGVMKKVHVISNGIDSERFKPRSKPLDLMKKMDIPLNKKIVLYTGRLDAEKKLTHLIDAIPIVLRQEPNTFFVIGGKGKQKRYLEEKAKRIGVEEATRFIGFVSDDELPFVYNMADVYSMLSDIELQSITTLEAVASGVICVVSGKGAVPELVQDQKSGFIYHNTDNPQEIARDLVKALNVKNHSTMAKHARQIGEHHRIANTIDAYEKILRSVIPTK